LKPHQETELRGLCGVLTVNGAGLRRVSEDDPGHLFLTLCRYRFVAKALSGFNRVLQVGWSDAFAAALVQQEVGHLTAIDFDQRRADDLPDRMSPKRALEYRRHDLVAGPVPGSFDAGYALDFVGHIPAAQEEVLVRNTVRSLTPEGILILGSPSPESQASGPLPHTGQPGKSGKALRALAGRFFHNVLLFSMIDEVFYAGLISGAKYFIAIGSTRREPVAPVRSLVSQGEAAGLDPLDITIFVPCLNEQNHIGPTLDTITAAMSELPYSYEVLVVDDASTDETSKIVENYIQAHLEAPIRLISNAKNRGLSTSYVDAAFLGRGTYYRMVCGDNAEPKEALIGILQRLGEADMVIPYHEHVTGKPARRVWLSRLYTAMVNLLSGYKIRYYNGMAIHLRHNVMRWGPYSFGFGFQAELITRLLDEGATYTEVPVKEATHREKAKGSSALNQRNFLSVAHTLSEVLIRRVRKRALHK
jgi:SAM-dependent methyltransferase